MMDEFDYELEERSSIMPWKMLVALFVTVFVGCLLMFLGDFSGNVFGYIIAVALAAAIVTAFGTGLALLWDWALDGELLHKWGRGR